MTLTKFGIREWGGSLIIATALIIVFLILAQHCNRPLGISLAVFTFIVWVAIAAFFRNPKRELVKDPAVLISPADGVVKDIEIVEDHGFELFGDKPVKRIGIFLSVLDVHVNRAPVKMTVNFKKYREGRYLDARDPRCGKENEAMTIGGIGEIDDYKFPVAVTQISGAIARRIVCPVEKDQVLPRGHIYGMIKFGSRTELYLPADSQKFETLVKVGDRVFAGESGLAKLIK